MGLFESSYSVNGEHVRERGPSVNLGQKCCWVKFVDISKGISFFCPWTLRKKRTGLSEDCEEEEGENPVNDFQAGNELPI